MPETIDPNSPELNPPPPENLNTGVQPSSDSVDTTPANRVQFELVRAVLTEKDQELARLRQELANRNNAPVEDAQPWQTFTDDPRTVIRNEVMQQVKPINDFIQDFRKSQQLDNILSQFKTVPAYATVLTQGESYVRQVLQGADVTVQTVEAAINIVAGKLAMGQLTPLGVPAPVPPKSDDPKFNNAPSTKAPKNTPPPHLSPSSHPVSKPIAPESEKPWEDLSENELRLARFNKMSPEEYYNSLHSDDVMVVSQSKKKK